MGNCQTCGKPLGARNISGFCQKHFNRPSPNSWRSRTRAGREFEEKHALAAAGMLRDEEAARERAARLTSDTAPLKPGDLEEVDYGEQRQAEYKKEMGEFAGTLRELAGDPAKVAAFVS